MWQPKCPRSEIVGDRPGAVVDSSGSTVLDQFDERHFLVPGAGILGRHPQWVWSGREGPESQLDEVPGLPERRGDGRCSHLSFLSVRKGPCHIDTLMVWRTNVTSYGAGFRTRGSVRRPVRRS